MRGTILFFIIVISALLALGYLIEPELESSKSKMRVNQSKLKKQEFYKSLKKKVQKKELKENVQDNLDAHLIFPKSSQATDFIRYGKQEFLDFLGISRLVDKCESQGKKECREENEEDIFFNSHIFRRVKMSTSKSSLEISAVGGEGSIGFYSNDQESFIRMELERPFFQLNLNSDGQPTAIKINSSELTDYFQKVSTYTDNQQCERLYPYLETLDYLEVKLMEHLNSQRDSLIDSEQRKQDELIFGVSDRFSILQDVFAQKIFQLSCERFESY